VVSENLSNFTCLFIFLLGSFSNNKVCPLNYLLNKGTLLEADIGKNSAYS
jgi:hypothetical protein